MLDHDPRYLRPGSREDMNLRFQWLSASPTRRRRKKKAQAAPTTRSQAMVDAKGMHQDPTGLQFGRVDASEVVFQRRRIPPPGRLSLSGTIDSDTSIQDGASEPVCLSRPTNMYSSPSSSSEDVQDIKNRTSGCSTQYAAQVSTLLRKLTIGSESYLMGTPPRSAKGSLFPADSLERDPVPSGVHILPGDLLNLHRHRSACLQGLMHEGGRCWCAVADSIAASDNMWVLENGELSPQAYIVLQNPSRLNLSVPDRFGNTPLHLFAARDGFQLRLMTMVSNSDDPAATKHRWPDVSPRVVAYLVLGSG